MLSVAITGASSFTGCWIANFLAHSNFIVHALYSRKRSAYSDLVQKRVEFNQTLCNQHFEIDALDGSMARWIQLIKPNIWIHHHHWTQDFKSKNFDESRALQVGLQPLNDIVAALSRIRCKGIIYSGSFYENLSAEDISENIRRYTHTKIKVQTELDRLCRIFKVPLSKLYIPNAVGPFENPNRLVPTLIRAARAQSPLHLATPNAFTALYPILELGEAYRQLALRLDSGECLSLSPQGESRSVLDWAQIISRDFIRAKLNLNLEFPSFVGKLNAEVPFHWDQAWEHYARFELQNCSNNFITSPAHPQDNVTPLPPCP